jgi:uncharacterized protein YbjT (DUF2867 family)
MIVLIGASGQVGTPTIRHLIRKGAKIRTLTSSAVSTERLRRVGVTEIGDFRKDEDVRRVVDGATTVFHVCPRFTEDEPEIGKRVVAAARACGVEHYDEHGFPGGNPTVLASLLGRQPTGYREFIKRLIAQDRL